MRTEHLGPDELLRRRQGRVRPELTFDELAGAIDATEANVRAAVPATRLIYIEPDFKRPTVGRLTGPWAIR